MKRLADVRREAAYDAVLRMLKAGKDQGVLSRILDIITADTSTEEGKVQAAGMMVHVEAATIVAASIECLADSIRASFPPPAQPDDVSEAPATPDQAAPVADGACNSEAPPHKVMVSSRG